MTLQVLQDVLRCAYDPEAWQREMHGCKLRCDSSDPAQLLAAIERVDQVTLAPGAICQLTRL